MRADKVFECPCGATYASRTLVWMCQTHQHYRDRLSPPVDHFLRTVWSLIYTMEENGLTGEGQPWGEPFAVLRAILEKRGFTFNAQD